MQRVLFALTARRAMRVFAITVLVAFGAQTAHAQAPAPRLAALAPADDALKAVAIGPGGEVYEPDGKGAWVRKQRVSTANRIAHVGRAGGAIIAFGEGIVYRLAPNGWSAIRLHQKQRAITSSGIRAIAAVGRQLFVLDRSAGGEPAKLAVAPSNVLAIAAGTAGVIVQTDRGLLRVQGAGVVAVPNAPKQIDRLVSDRWVLVPGGAIDLKTGRKTGWPPGVTITAAAATADERLVLVAAQRGALELVTTKGDKLAREPIVVVAAAPAPGAPSSPTPPLPPASPPPGAPVGVVLDKAGRAVIALDDGTLLVRGDSKAAWTATRVTDDLPPPRPGSRPAVSP